MIFKLLEMARLKRLKIKETGLVFFFNSVYKTKLLNYKARGVNGLS